MTVERRRMSRTRILQGAIDILDEGVYGDLTVDALARSLHMSKSTLYKYFASKDAVVIALIEASCADTESELAGIDLTSMAPRDALDTIASVLASHADRIPRAAILQQARLPGACQDRLQLTRANLGQALHRTMMRGVDDGTFAFHDAVLASTAFLAGADAAMKASARGEVSGSRGDSVRALLGLFLPGLLKGQAAA